MFLWRVEKMLRSSIKIRAKKMLSGLESESERKRYMIRYDTCTSWKHDPHALDVLVFFRYAMGTS
jgi:hypothetical protein